MKEVLKDVTNGNLTIRNVPHLYNDGKRFADGELYIFPAKSVYYMSFIFSYMIQKGIQESDFNGFQYNEVLIPSIVDESKIRGGKGSNAISKPLTLKEKILYATLDAKSEEL